ncbi:MAG: AAA family ATPase [Rhodospirillaceae bacterium]
MTLRKLDAAAIGYPPHPIDSVDDRGYFALSSHKRAREALRFGLDMPGIGFNSFVIGEDRSGRMDATLALLQGYVSARPPADDWVYLNNFTMSHRPAPCRLPAGHGVRFRACMADLVDALRDAAPGRASAVLDRVIEEFSAVESLQLWFESLRRDVSEQDGRLLCVEPDSPDNPERRYAVNLFVDNADQRCPPVVVEPNPTYGNLFGTIEYARLGPNLVTDFTRIRAGALHRANGGILVLRAEALSRQPVAWEALKGALRDRKIRIEEPHRTGTIPIASAPRPLSIPFDAKVVIVGAPRWYHGWFLNDPESRIYFKVKADICEDLGATPENAAAYVGMIRRFAAAHRIACDGPATALLLGTASRWAEHRQKFSSQLELLEDLIAEAALIARHDGSAIVTRSCVTRAADERRRRVSQVEDRLHRSITEGQVMISTDGHAVGQVNGLLVFNRTDHQYGAPCRVTARSWIGRRGVINIERQVDLGGPIQHKGVLGLHGYLAGCFARAAPVSFSASITFEQNYGGVEGDSASLAELLAILSDLAAIPLRQDLAVTGSINQRGDVQAVSGTNHKVEGFFRTCRDRGGLTGSQGVVIPESNLVNLVLHDELCEAVAAGRFHIWTVARVEAAVALFTGLPTGEPNDSGRYPEDSVYGRVAARLAVFDRILLEREPAV